MKYCINADIQSRCVRGHLCNVAQSLIAKWSCRICFFAHCFSMLNKANKHMHLSADYSIPAVKIVLSKNYDNLKKKNIGCPLVLFLHCNLLAFLTDLKNIKVILCS